jgi:Sulfotransferase family
MSNGSPSIDEVSRAARNLMAKGDFAGAGQCLEQAIAVSPHNAHLHWQLGVCFASSNRLRLAHDCFRRAVHLDPSMAAAHASLGAWYLLHGIVDLALQSSGISFALAPNDPRIVQSHARILEAGGQLDAAWELTCRLIDQGNITPGIVRLYGRMARYRNQQPAALALVMRLLNNHNISPGERARLHFTAADLLDSVQQYDQAFSHAIAGNQHPRPRYDPATHEKTFDEFIAYFTAERFKKLACSTERSSKPVFIIGMPRSGTSLVEQIIAAHPNIHGGGELDLMEHVFHGTLEMLDKTMSSYPQCLDRLTLDQANGMAQVYLQPLCAMSPAATFITDKLPLNFLHLGLIQLLLPGARIIHCRRNAIDTCLSCYMNSFSSGHDFKFDLTHLGLFHRQYQRLMSHWSKVLHLPILEVDYEAVVNDPEVQTRRLLEFLELPWNPTCLDFHQVNRAVFSSSVQQVHQPLYASSVHRWKHYEKHLGPLIAALGK